MAAESDDEQDGFGSELRRLQTPQFALLQRRRAFWTGAVGILLGLMSLALGVDAMRTGKWVTYGRVGSTLVLPGWAVVLAGVFLLVISGWVLLRFARKP